MNDIQKILSGEKSARENAPDDDVARADIDSSLKYFVIFAAMGGGSTFLFSYQLALFNAFPGLYELISSAVTVLFLLLLIIFQSLMIKSTKFNIILILIEIFGIFSFFLGRFSSLHVVAALIFFLFWYLGFEQGRKILHQSITIRFFAFAGTVVNYTLIGFALLLSLLYAGIYRSGGGISADLYHKFLSGSAPAIRSIVPNFVPEMTVDGFFENFVAKQVEKYGEVTAGLDAAEKEKTTRELATGIRNELLKDAAPAQTNESVSQYSYRLLGEQFKKLNDKGFGIFVVIAIAALIFFPIRLILLIFKWPILILARVLFSALEVLGVIEILSEKRDKELLVVR